MKPSDSKINRHFQDLAEDIKRQGGAGRIACPKCHRIIGEECEVTQTRKPNAVEVGQYEGIRVYSTCKAKDIV